MNRRIRDEIAAVDGIVESAVRQARAPGAASLGATGSSAGAVISPGLDDNNHLDAGGNSIRAFMLGVDALGAPNRFLIVKGRKIDYGS